MKVLMQIKAPKFTINLFLSMSLQANDIVKIGDANIANHK